ncbi:MAG: helix-turn-helix domain-containing protein [Dysgonamonadaceae bacterium]|jgi:transcriptional regulator with XRE-family HTH domain|nr:helix-turn-helix domain-containing protein [Dysgonamonadaceae bacterium]
MKSTNIHIGENILAVMNQKGVTKAELARLLSIKPQSVDYLLKRKSIDTDTLYNISVALDFDFSLLYRINQLNSEQTNFDINSANAKIMVEIMLNLEDIIKLNLKKRVTQILDK